MTWKLSTFGAIAALALGKAHISLQLAMIAVAGVILEQQAKRSTQAT